MRTSATLVGLDPAEVPATERALHHYYARVRPQLRVTRVALRNVLWGFAPPMPRWVELATPARPAWAGMVATAWAMLPPWARRLYRMPGLVTTDLGATLIGRGLRRTLRLLPDDLIRPPAQRAAQARLLQAG